MPFYEVDAEIVTKVKMLIRADSKKEAEAQADNHDFYQKEGKTFVSGCKRVKCKLEDKITEIHGKGFY